MLVSLVSDRVNDGSSCVAGDSGDGVVADNLLPASVVMLCLTTIVAVGLRF